MYVPQCMPQTDGVCSDLVLQVGGENYKYSHTSDTFNEMQIASRCIDPGFVYLPAYTMTERGHSGAGAH
eukprot:3955979-Pleurochrysis_carterae.AAC.1